LKTNHKKYESYSYIVLSEKVKVWKEE